MENKSSIFTEKEKRPPENAVAHAKIINYQIYADVKAQTKRSISFTIHQYNQKQKKIPHE